MSEPTTMKARMPGPLLLTLLLLCSVQCVQAEENDRFTLQDRDGFVTTLPDVSPVNITQHLVALQQDLKIELTNLKEEVQRKSFKAFDTLVSAIMPGGLIYAKLRFDAYKKSERKMNRVNEELNQISGELVAFQTVNDERMRTSLE